MTHPFLKMSPECLPRSHPPPALPPHNHKFLNCGVQSRPLPTNHTYLRPRTYIPHDALLRTLSRPPPPPSPSSAVRIAHVFRRYFPSLHDPRILNLLALYSLLPPTHTSPLRNLRTTRPTKSGFADIPPDTPRHPARHPHASRHAHRRNLRNCMLSDNRLRD